ncbi:putative rhamnogalacturonate lyase C [Pseudocercospora fuligena]|uniref:Putative rhamnogalacturonate lyase C n=1 Tax=Pseudocercospora fuligena TaxID=685502 RepID=A0A8H6VEG4_9PEZI|nr:putative rhamnogalacturonate lyase C [Pseudocercospora fuligena]
MGAKDVEPSAPTHTIKLPGHRLRSVAQWLLSKSPPAQHPKPSKDAIKIVIVSDTHNNKPNLPPGDLLIHAGDMTEWGSFDEIQDQLSWLNAQSHTHKIVIAGNHDILFDQIFLDTHQDRFPTEPGKTKNNLNFGDVIYLENSAITLSFPSSKKESARTLKIYGSPWTPKYLDSAFQYPIDEDPWSKLTAGEEMQNVDILITHGPAWGHVDGSLRRGCQFLAHHVARWKPRLHISGHIHVGYGREVVRYDGVRRRYEEVQRGWAGWWSVAMMAICVLWINLSGLLFKRKQHITEHVNAAVVGDGNQVVNEAIVVSL